MNYHPQTEATLYRNCLLGVVGGAEPNRYFRFSVVKPDSKTIVSATVFPTPEAALEAGRLFLDCMSQLWPGATYEPD